MFDLSAKVALVTGGSRGLGRAMLTDPRLVTWLDRYATYSGSDPRRAPSVLSVTSYVEQHFGAWYLRGGLRRLADALLWRCQDLGVEVHLDSEVTRVGRSILMPGETVAILSTGYLP